MWVVRWNAFVEKLLERVPKHIVEKFRAWIQSVEENGLSSTRKSPGFHDKPLKGARSGQRSIRLNRAYRAFYMERTDGEVEIVQVIEVNKHEY